MLTGVRDRVPVFDHIPNWKVGVWTFLWALVCNCLHSRSILFAWNALLKECNMTWYSPTLAAVCCHFRTPTGMHCLSVKYGMANSCSQTKHTSCGDQWTGNGVCGRREKDRTWYKLLCISQFAQTYTLGIHERLWHVLNSSVYYDYAFSGSVLYCLLMCICKGCHPVWQPRLSSAHSSPLTCSPVYTMSSPYTQSRR